MIRFYACINNSRRFSPYCFDTDLLFLNDDIRPLKVRRIDRLMGRVLSVDHDERADWINLVGVVGFIGVLGYLNFGLT